MEVEPGYKHTEVGVIPEDWEMKRLGEISEFITSGSRGWAAFYSDNGALFIRSQNVRGGTLDFEDSQFVNPPNGAEGNRTRVNLDDLLITITGNSVGNVALVEDELGEAYISQHVGLVRLSEPKLGHYVCRFLSPSSPGNRQIWASQSGQSKPGLTLRNLQEFWVALPPTDAEKRAITEALSDMDALLGELERLIAKKRDLKQAAMQQLLTAGKRLPGFHGNWDVKRLDTLSDIRSGGTPSTADPRFWDGDIPWCTPTDITALNGHKYLSETSRMITLHGLKASSAEMIPAHSIVMTSRATIGECAINTVPVSTNQGFKNLVPFETIDVDFLYYLLQTQRQGFINLCGGSTFLEIGKTQLAAYLVRIPSEKEEQTAIAEVLTDMDAELTALDQRREKTRALKQAMMQELLTGKTRLK
jgi:type I restriction enzyme S subunit